MNSKREQIIQLRKENPIIRLTKIANNLSVSKSYVHKVLTQANLPTKSILSLQKRSPKRIVCKACDEDIPPESLHSERVHHIHSSCRYNYMYILVTCRFCRTKFRRRRHRIQDASRSKYIYCSQACHYKGMKNDSTYDLRLNKQLIDADSA